MANFVLVPLITILLRYSFEGVILKYTPEVAVLKYIFVGEITLDN